MESPDSKVHVLVNALTVNKTLKEVTIQQEGTEWTYWVFIKWWIQALEKCNSNIAFIVSL